MGDELLFKQGEIDSLKQRIGELESIASKEAAKPKLVWEKNRALKGSVIASYNDYISFVIMKDKAEKNFVIGIRKPMGEYNIANERALTLKLAQQACEQFLNELLTPKILANPEKPS